jgi:hypothetical protein
MAKKRTINELRQTKDAVYTNPGVQKPSKSFIEDQEAAKQLAESKSEEMKENRKYPKFGEVESAKELIINKIIKHFDDVMFEMVSEEMSNNYLFNSDNYLTEAGYDLFEDEWFEWYHNHHGDILYEVKKNLFE